MSKMDAQRAMREARYERMMARAGKAGATDAAKPRAAAPKAKPPVASEPPAAAAPDGQLCGHRAISGKTCTREHGHTAKSHRYA